VGARLSHDDELGRAAGNGPRFRPECINPDYPVPPVPQQAGTLEYDLKQLGHSPLLLNLEDNGLYPPGSKQNVDALMARAEVEYRHHFRAVVYMDVSRETDLKYPGGRDAWRRMGKQPFELP
jgi:hypothetical protein